MRPEDGTTQRGFSLVPALFLLIVLAGLGTVAVRMTAVQSQTVALAMQSARAFAAAKSGIEWSSHQALTAASCSDGTLTLTQGGLAGFTVQTSCRVTNHTEGSTTVSVYVIDAFARYGVYGNPDYVTRRLRATVTDAS